MAKRKKCPKCGRDTWSEKWQECSSADCRHGVPASRVAEIVKNTTLAQARADAAGNRRQVRKALTKKMGGTMVRGLEEEAFSEGDAGDRRKTKRLAHPDAKKRGDYKGPLATFAPTAEEEREQADGPVDTEAWPKSPTAIGAQTLWSPCRKCGRPRPWPSVLSTRPICAVCSFALQGKAAPGETCPTCNRNVPKRRKADAADSV